MISIMSRPGKFAYIVFFLVSLLHVVWWECSEARKMLKDHEKSNEEKKSDNQLGSLDGGLLLAEIKPDCIGTGGIGGGISGGVGGGGIGSGIVGGGGSGSGSSGVKRHHKKKPNKGHHHDDHDGGGSQGRGRLKGGNVKEFGEGIGGGVGGWFGGGIGGGIGGGYGGGGGSGGGRQ